MNCVICSAEVHNSFACADCTRGVEGMISHAGVTTDGNLCMLDELDLVMSRQTRSVERVGGRSAEKPLPFDARAAKAHASLAHILSRWAKVYGLVNSGRGPRYAASHLLRQRLASKPDILWLHVELKHAMETAQAAIDRPPNRTYIGVCSAPRNDDSHCSAELYANEGEQQLVCPLCSATHSVSDRRDVLMTAVEDVLATATEITRAVHLFNEPIRVGRIYNWKYTGRLEPRGFDDRGAPLYRIGDVLALVRKTASRDSDLTNDPARDTMS